MDLTSLLQMTGIAGGLGLFFWKIIDKRFDKIDKQFEKVDNKTESIASDVQEIKERIAGLEAETILYNMIPDENRRSEAAKRMWEKRRGRRALKVSSQKQNHGP